MLSCTKSVHGGDTGEQCLVLWVSYDKISIAFECKIVDNFLPISFDICFGGSKDHLIEMVLLSTHNICLG